MIIQKRNSGQLDNSSDAEQPIATINVPKEQTPINFALLSVALLLV
jgi:hypothetical protein